MNIPFVQSYYNLLSLPGTANDLQGYLDNLSKNGYTGLIQGDENQFRRVANKLAEKIVKGEDMSTIGQFKILLNNFRLITQWIANIGQSIYTKYSEAVNQEEPNFQRALETSQNEDLNKLSTDKQLELLRFQGIKEFFQNLKSLGFDLSQTSGN